MESINALALVNTMGCKTNIKIDFYQHGEKIDEYKGKACINSVLDGKLYDKIVGRTDIIYEEGTIYILINVY